MLIVSFPYSSKVFAAILSSLIQFGQCSIPGGLWYMVARMDNHWRCRRLLCYLDILLYLITEGEQLSMGNPDMFHEGFVFV